MEAAWTALVLLIPLAAAEILTPPYFNLALGKRITATATCGDEGRELYCKLVGANADHDEPINVIQGQICDYCDAEVDSQKHPPEYAVDDMETWWQSPPLSRGMKYNEVNVTIDLGQEFHVAYVFVRMGNSPRPGLWALEKSTDYGKTFKPWQYFSDSPQDCERYFGKESIQPITRDDSVICSTEYSKIVPLEGGEIPISLLNYRPSSNKYFNSSVLQEWTRATNVRLRLLRTKNLLGHLMSVARQDPTVTRRYFYSIKDIEIGGRCMCNGHADNCDPSDTTNILVCRCHHNTCGPQCAECCPGFEQKKWRISQNWDRFDCEPCNCHNHSTECVYDPEIDANGLSLDIHGNYEGGGVCQNCQHNTEGINCNKCKPTFYRPYGKQWGELDVCAPCECDPHFSTGNCAEETGQCECRVEFNPPNCDSCAYGYFDYPDCKPCTCNLNGTEGSHCTPIGGLCPCKFNYAGKSCEICADGYYSSECKSCECNTVGSVSTVCDKDSGNCTCRSKYAGRTCNQCEAGYYNYPTCSHCNCDTSGTLPNICDDVTGQCICKEGFGGARCDQCISGYYMEVRGRERVCVSCNCSAKGSTSTSCSADGKCNCLSNFGGKQCDQCSPGYYKYPDCLPCYCDVSGSIGSTCDDNGDCHCRPNFDGNKCDHCKEHFYNYPACEECNCDPRGVIPSFAGCGSVPAGELCQCKDRVQGRICNDCKPLYWNLQEYNPNGCEECDCHLAGTLGGLGSCNTKNGQCICKHNVGERRCDQCQDGYYRLETDNVFGCTECDCDIGGSTDNNCDKLTGQCRCNSRVEGRRCDQPIRAHYFPTLHQFQYEVEEGQTPSGAVRYRSSEEVFPGYSWKGYVVFSLLQNEVINEVHISKSSLYRMVLKYVNPLKDPVTASIIITPESIGDIQQKFSVLLRPTVAPQLVTVAGDKGNSPAPFVMNPGNWTVTIKTTKEVMIDYFVLIPEAYYEATVLTKLVNKPCEIGDNKLCRHFEYPSLDGFPYADVSGLMTSATSYIDNPLQLNELNASATDIPLMNDLQPELQYKMVIEQSGPYVLLVQYVTPVNATAQNEIATNATFEISAKGIVTVRFQSGEGSEEAGVINFNSCPYTAPCRQLVLDERANARLFRVTDTNNVVYLDGEPDTLVGIKSIVAVPEAEWQVDYMTGRAACLRRDGQCVPAVFSGAVDSKKLEAESGVGGDRLTRPPILDNSTVVVQVTPAAPLALEGRVPAPQDYVLLLHYYQPHHPETTLLVNVTTADGTYTARAHVAHCPSTSGCRALVQPPGESLPLQHNFTLTLQSENKGVWLDYILVVAAADYVDSVVKEANMLDYTREFISKCSMNHYQVATTDVGFCRDAVFSITADYNSGTLRCFCDVEGSLDLECDSFGGQCRCRPNVIGRTCSACKTGYYGFPDCKPCNCPSTAICDDDGLCICPKNVEGENCDRCKPYTFNFDVQRGCDDCNCNPLGVRGERLQCHADSGNCECKENVMGRVCDHCVPGHYAFPDCYQCHCDLAGTTDDVCDQNTAQCFCKKYVTGQSCDMCKEEYFNLQPDSPDGCTKCHCFGKTTRCSSAQLYWAEISGMWNWSLVNMEFERSLAVYPHTTPPSLLNHTVIGADLVTNDADDKIVYFAAPAQYYGKRLTSYGGYLKYSIFYTTQSGNGHAISAPDVVLGGSSGYIVHNSVEQPPSVENWEHAVRIAESDFTNVDGSAVSRDQLMNVLLNLTAIYIRATYWHEAVTTRLIDVSLDIGVEDWQEDAILASSVEQCQCPSAYRGASCEQCAEGHYRLSSGPHAGFCVPCQCNGHSGTCDVNTGVCLSCEDNTMGEHCEQCIPGYHGDATGGTPRDCLICACPMPYVSNNFATGCELSGNGSLISCTCREGYAGARCEFCAAGYYGVPEDIGDYCKPCNCSGNINLEDPGSCDSIDGSCLKCVNNTAGAVCNLCAPGYFGDAILSKNCTACDCDEYGTDHCDGATGLCHCRPGVVGARCDACLPDHWGVSSGRGCEPCACAAAAHDSQCDVRDGHCKCAKGVTGRRCDMCAAGYWNYSKDGCDHCNCNTGYSVGFTCNATGQCECLPGVVGEKCDRCPERWVLIPQEGCMACDSCTDALIFSVEDLRDLLANETQDFKDKADSFFTTQRLNYIWNQTQVLRPQLQQLQAVDAAAAAAAVAALEGQAKAALRSTEFAATDSERQIVLAGELTEDADEVLASVRQARSLLADTVAHVIDLATGLELSQQPKVDSALTEARQIKDDIAEKDLEPKKMLALSALTNSSEQLEAMNIFVQPVNEQSADFEKLVAENSELKEKCLDMGKYIDQAAQTIAQAERLNRNNRASKFNSKVNSVTELNGSAMEDLVDAAYSISNGTTLFVVAQQAVNDASAALEANENVKNQMVERIEALTADLPELNALAQQSQDHADSLRSRADSLRRLAERENNNTRTQHAYTAASAYSGIVQELRGAADAVDEAASAVAATSPVNEALQERMGPTMEQSVQFRDKAAQALRTAEDELSPNLQDAEKKLDEAKKLLASADDLDNAIRLSLPSPSAQDLSDASDKAARVKTAVDIVTQTMDSLGDELAGSKQRAQALPKVADEAVKMASSVRSLLSTMEQLDPQIKAEYGAVKAKQDDLELKRKAADEKLNKLRELIDQAHTVANRIQVGVSFDSTSTLQPRLPESVDEMSTSTRVSAFFRTNSRRSPAADSGLILYLGNPRDTTLRRTKTDDYMVVDIQNGYPVLQMDIGDGPAKVISDKFVADDKWYQLIVDRVGRNVKLSIRESLDNGSEVVHAKEASLPGQHTIFNLHRDKSRLYVGGAPSAALPTLQDVRYPAFEGQIEELMIGDTPVGLWNFASAANLKGARQRDKLITSQSGPQEYRFNGRGHVKVPARQYLQPDRNQVQLFFKTYAPDGLIYVVGDHKHFFSLQMQGGQVFLQVSLGNPQDLVIIGTNKTYNDGKWHKLDAARVQRVCSLRLDNEPHIKLESASDDVYIPAIDTMNFGGNNEGIIQVASQGFDGCMRQISIDRLNIDLSENVEAIGMGYGCQFASLVSLSGGDSFLRFVNVSSDNLQLTLKFQTAAPDALLFVYLNKVQTSNMQDSVSLSLVNGRLVLMSQKEVLDTGLATYNDSAWHVVSVTHGERALRLVVDDFDYFSTDTAPAPLNILDGVLFVGGLSPNYVISGKVGSRQAFAGCIADATVNGRVLNLLQPYANKSVVFGRCGASTSSGGVSPDEAPWVVTERSDVLPTALPPAEAAPEPPSIEPRAPALPPSTTTTRAPPAAEATSTRAPPQPEAGCALAHDPAYELGDPVLGYRFGTRNDSRIEYARLGGRQHDGFDLTASFRSFDAHGGLVFYAAAEKAPQQFLALYMKDGKLVMSFNCGAETVTIRSEQTYTGTDWHTVTLVRNEGRGKLSVDNQLVGEAGGKCVAPAALAPPFYYGGLAELTPDILTNLENFYQPFKGCLKPLLMNGQAVAAVRRRVSSLQCRDNVEDGVYFGPSPPGTTNYLRLRENFRVGYEISVSMEIKPRNSTGLLLSVHGKKDFLVLELLDRELVANVENGKGPFHASFKLGSKLTLCDGNWHKINVVKSRHAVSVGVDGNFSGAGLGQSGSTDTKSALFIGGHERQLSRVRGVKSRRGFSGCLRNIVIKEVLVTDIPLNAAHGNVHIGVCPVD
ncbi:laminin subunit alpha [Plutella xylostella]|uniref:laminin subunit alpha n=1 Tax=Plutella xylostella TaxID=51655 RepID=UPI00203264C6|nr:laminin subunit alpha [Plutella xylostella]